MVSKNKGKAKTRKNKADLPPPAEWIKGQSFKTTDDVVVPEVLVDQVIGQDDAVEVVKKAAEQRRHVMIIGDPGTGKSMLARAMSELLPKSELQDILVLRNPEDSHCPKVRVVPAGKGKEIISAKREEAMRKQGWKVSLQWMILLMIGMIVVWAVFTYNSPIYALYGLMAAAMVYMAMQYTRKRETFYLPKLLVSHTPNDTPPFEDATGAHAGALLGDVRHDPYQAGGLETPAHERVEVGAVHRANKGVLYIDEVHTLAPESQYSLLTGLQERKFPITGQSERSAGALVKTEPVPCDFTLVLAGNLDSVQGMHPALRSRIQGYGYEVYVRSEIEDNEVNREKLIRFAAQEVKKDEKIPPLDQGAVAEIIHEAQRRSGRKGHLTLRLRELGGLIRIAGDRARDEDATVVTAEHVLTAKRAARSIERQVADRYLRYHKEYQMYLRKGRAVGRVNGLAVMGEDSGIVLPIVAEVTPAMSKSEGKMIATGKLGEIAKEAVQNVSALIKKYTGQDVSNYDVHIQFIGTHEGVEGDSASVSVATAVISALNDVPINQSVAMTGSLSVRGEVLPVGGITPKIEAAADAGLKKILIPQANAGDVLIEDKYKKMVKVVTVKDIKDVLSNILVGPKKKGLIEKLYRLVPSGIPQRASKVSG